MTDFDREQQLRDNRLAPLQQRPEFREWLARQEEGLRVFFSEVVPDMPSDPYTEEGASHAEAAALAIFPDVDAADPATAPQNLRQIDAFQRYIGELFVRTYEGRWVFDQLDADSAPEPVVELPYSTAQIPPRTVLTSLAFRRRGGEIAFIFREQAEDYQLWVEAGRPSLPEWRRIRSDLRLQRLLDS